MISAMPELATGLTNILIIVSAFGCMLWLRKFNNVQLWQALFIVVTLCGLMGCITHCFIFTEKTELTLWIILDILLGASVTLLSLASINQCVGHATWQATLATTLLGIITVFFMVRSEITDGSFNYPACIVTAFLAVASLATDCAIQVHRIKGLAKFGLVLPGIAIMLAAGIPCIWFKYSFSIGQIIINQSAVLHTAIAIAFPFLCKGVSSLLLQSQTA